MKQYDFLTGFRGIAAIWVVLYHFKEILYSSFPKYLLGIIDNGYYAVDFFFILSGFVIGLNYSKSVQSFKWKEIYPFYIKRIARIYPLHFVVLILYLSIPISYIYFSKPIPALTYNFNSFIMNLFLVQNWGFLNQLTWNVPSWSISTEFASYLLFPLIIYPIARVKNIGHLVFITAMLFILLHTICYLTGLTTIGDRVPKIGIVRCIIEFTIGIIIYSFTTIIPANFSRKAFSYTMMVVAAVLFSLPFICGLSDSIVVPLSFSLFIFANLVNSNIVTKIFSLKILVYIGEISYSIYLLHYLIRDIFKMAFIKDINHVDPFIIMLYFFFVFASSILTYHFIELPSKNFFTKILIKKGENKKQLLFQKVIG